MSPATGAETERAATACMASLVASLADNKAALGRRYGEWAVSAPTLESAVAAAAMAQDELGHARSTYPVVKALGGEVDENGFGGPRRLSLLDDQLPDWTTLISANLLVDGTLTTFVASCAESSLTQMAQRARKILQEEGSHRVHAEAWARRLCGDGPAQRALLVERLEQAWEHAGRWTGPAADPGFQAALDLGMTGMAPQAQRELVRAWLTELLAASGANIALPEPTDWSAWDAATRRWST